LIENPRKFYSIEKKISFLTVTTKEWKLKLFDLGTFLIDYSYSNSRKNIKYKQIWSGHWTKSFDTLKFEVEQGVNEPFKKVKFIESNYTLKKVDDNEFFPEEMKYDLRTNLKTESNIRQQ
jgi:hypothetical protein